MQQRGKALGKNEDLSKGVNLGIAAVVSQKIHRLTLASWVRIHHSVIVVS
ncbi:hypothetical protein AB2S62_04355 [Vibrio sp. NTOU-M3]